MTLPRDDSIMMFLLLIADAFVTLILDQICFGILV
jgi:hypothetical protein